MFSLRLIHILFSNFVVATKHQIWMRALGSTSHGIAMADRRQDVDKTVRQRGKQQSRYAPNLIEDDVNDKMNRRTKRKIFSWVRRVALVLIIVLGLALLIIPSPIDPVSFSLPDPPVFEGPLAPNNKLQQAEKIYEGEVIGPESLEKGRGGFYTGLADGRIIKITKNKIEEIAKLGKPPCGGVENEHTCGRPLGVRFHKDGNLYAVDAYSGIYRVFLETGDAMEIFSTREPVNGRPLMFVNDLDIASEDMIYFTDSSDKFERRQNKLLALEGSATGRVFQLNPYTDEVTLLMDGLALPNGIQISAEEDYILICETLRSRIHKYYLDGPKQGTSEIFIDNLPGLPDNIRYSNGGGYWVGFAAVRKQPFSMYDFMASRPWIRTFIAKLFNQEFIMNFVPKYGLVVELDENGKIIRSLHDPTGQTITGVSEVLDLGSHLYFGSYDAPFIGKLSYQNVYS
ncbi:adipocyte plasma membrane-associated protein-like [Amphiura filiformis]|uniref:adipocyte plasma membrane-associated protein-like n=1 Tax=Amphiura filiformis TaxID=82378 RepID=UPI003B20BBA0